EINVHDILVAGEHQALFRHIARGRTATPNVIDHSHADVDLVDAQRLWREDGLDGIRQMVIQPRLYFAYFLSEAEHHAEFVWLDPEEPGKPPERKNTKRDESKSATAKVPAG